MNHVLCGLAANPALPSGAVDRLITTADDDIATAPAEREDLTPTQAAAPASRVERRSVTAARGDVEAGALSGASCPSAAFSPAASTAPEPDVHRPDRASRIVRRKRHPLT
ncbi:hypothetical protein [Streptosporangium sp. H16]|uniref:hypothetical protein n=1 Tax=Streptosporangium sp. H16 TaxID=3444184 RepID=UPI003F7B3549